MQSIILRPKQTRGSKHKLNIKDRWDGGGGVNFPLCKLLNVRKSERDGTFPPNMLTASQMGSVGRLCLREGCTVTAQAPIHHHLPCDNQPLLGRPAVPVTIKAEGSVSHSPPWPYVIPPRVPAPKAFLSPCFGGLRASEGPHSFWLMSFFLLAKSESWDPNASHCGAYGATGNRLEVPSFPFTRHLDSSLRGYQMKEHSWSCEFKEHGMQLSHRLGPSA